MPSRDEVPEEAIRAAAKAVGPRIETGYMHTGLTVALRAAAPAIRNQERQRIQKALAEKKRSLWREARLADEEGGDGSYYGHVVHGIEQAEAVLDILDPSEQGEEECDWCGGIGAEGFKTGPSGMHGVDAALSSVPCSKCNGTGKKPATDPSKEEQLLRRADEAEARAPRCSCGGAPDHPKQHKDCHVVASSKEVGGDGE